MTTYTTQDQTQLLSVIAPTELPYAELPQRVTVPEAPGLLGAFDFEYHRYSLYRQGEAGVWVFMHPWRRADTRHDVGAVLGILTHNYHAAFNPVRVDGQLVFDPGSHSAVTVEEVAAAFWSDAR